MKKKRWKFSGVISASFSLSRAAQRLLGSQGAHGYDPADHPDMHGIWFAVGRGIPAGRVVASASVVDVAPSAARLLHLAPPRHSEGRVLEVFAGRADASLQSPEARP